MDRMTSNILQPPIRQYNMRFPGESREVIFVNDESEFGTVFDQFVGSMGPFKVIGVGFYSDEVPDDGRRKSKNNKAAARRRRKRLLQRGMYDPGQYRQFTNANHQFDAGDNGNGNVQAAENVDRFASDDEFEDIGDGASSGEEQMQEKEEDILEHMRHYTQESGRVALLSISTMAGSTLLIRTCHFGVFPQPLLHMLQGNEYLKIGFGIHGDKHRIYHKHNFFIYNFVDPRRPLLGWKQFVDGFHFDRFGLHSVASYLFDQQIHNIDAAACLSSKWCAAELNQYQKRAAVRKTQLTVDVFAEICVQKFGRRVARYSLTPDVFKDVVFHEELLLLSQGYINSGFDQKDFGIKVFSTPSFQRRYRQKKVDCDVTNVELSNDTVPDTFADRVRLRRSKSTIGDYWKASLLYASFDVSLFDHQRQGNTTTLTRKVNGVCWEMKVKVIPKGTYRSDVNQNHTIPALAYYKKEVRLEELCGVQSNGVGAGWPGETSQDQPMDYRHAADQAQSGNVNYGQIADDEAGSGNPNREPNVSQAGSGHRNYEQNMNQAQSAHVNYVRIVNQPQPGSGRMNYGPIANQVPYDHVPYGTSTFADHVSHVDRNVESPIGSGLRPQALFQLSSNLESCWPPTTRPSRTVGITNGAQASPGQLNRVDQALMTVRLNQPAMPVQLNQSFMPVQLPTSMLPSNTTDLKMDEEEMKVQTPQVDDNSDDTGEDGFTGPRYSPVPFTAPPVFPSRGRGRGRGLVMIPTSGNGPSLSDNSVRNGTSLSGNSGGNGPSLLDNSGGNRPKLSDNNVHTMYANNTEFITPQLDTSVDMNGCLPKAQGRGRRIEESELPPKPNRGCGRGRGWMEKMIGVRPGEPCLQSNPLTHPPNGPGVGAVRDVGRCRGNNIMPPSVNPHNG